MICLARFVAWVIRCVIPDYRAIRDAIDNVEHRGTSPNEAVTWGSLGTTGPESHTAAGWKP